MATTSRQPANVQAYLDKHKISSIFEELTSLLVKELPDNPLDFIILKLQAKKKKGVSSSARPVTSSATGPKKKLDVTGTAISSKPAQPSKPKTTGASATTSRPGSGTKPTTSTTGAAAARSKGDSSTGIAPKKSTGVPTKTTGVPSKTTGVPTKTTGVPTKATGVPTKTTGTPSKSTGTSGSGLVKPTTPKSKIGTPSGLKKPGTPAGSKTPPTKPKATTAAKKPVTEKKQVKPTEKVAAENVSREDVTREDVSREDVTREEPEDISDDEVGGALGGDVSDSDDTDAEAEPQIDILELLRKRQRCKHSIKQSQEKEHLKLLLYKDSSPVSGYHSGDDDDDDEGEGLEVVESIDALEEEGVVLTGEARRMSLKLPTPGPTVALNVRVCARCAKVLSGEDATSTMSKLTSIDEFESASQINSHVSFPQWDMESSEQGELSAKQKWAMGCATSNTATGTNVSATNASGTGELASEVTVTTEDTPQTHPQDVPSDEESELQASEPVDQKPDEEHEPDNEASVEDSEITDDTWKGLSPQPHPQDLPSDEESELKLPEPVDYQKPDNEDSSELTSEVTEDISETHPQVLPSDEAPEPVDQKSDEDHEPDNEASVEDSEVTDDTWKGLSPQPHPQDVPSDEESELKIPPSVDYEKPEESVAED